MITVVVNDRETNKIYPELNIRYKNEKYVKVIPISDIEQAEKTGLYLFVGNNTKIDTTVPHIDLSDSKLMPSVNKGHTIEQLRELLLDGIIEFVSEDQIIGMDLCDLFSAMQESTNVKIGIMNSNEILEEGREIESALMNTFPNYDECKAVYIYFKGVLQLIEAAEIAEEVCRIIGEKNVIYAVRYDEAYEDSCCIVTLCFCQN